MAPLLAGSRYGGVWRGADDPVDGAPRDVGDPVGFAFGDARVDCGPDDLVPALVYSISVSNEVDVTDLGLRLADIEEYSLQSEPWREKVSRDKTIATLCRHGATRDEAFPIEGADREFTWGKRVELNAFTSEEFIGWLEDKLIEAGIGKVVPGDATLQDQYRRAGQARRQPEDRRGQRAGAR
jgi:hypothetical protein